MRSPISLDLALDHRAAAEQDRLRDAVVHQRLRRAQHALVLAFAIDDAPRRLLGGLEHRPHQLAGAEHEAFQVALIGAKSWIGRRATPLSIAARATAGAISRISRGSNGLGMM